ncbi:phytochrome A-associated F-box protein [Salvia miltiorrhiza]|uniref:phytochrome A-associated F-box protein n=1 Tax=Salvia miltiorrhiza TaxID=226208 RepID=UPI0025AC44BB|nr:phytochrome A-associated F-box protein [Salvia miltiorrhiza]XP_057782324.1 phytochrome A-associated F-box protein [Salvia miltiorrhiza]XP_057782325.1 phytochrome A-associated F-box protein [Salvia miltiorrhiza]XP_057782326.1 phytochrome A-associated F-box protein [Salvia miltiorrhiza]
MSESVFSKLSDDVILNILYKLQDDPRIWARIACVSTKFSALIRTVCWRTKCSQSIPAVVSDLQPDAAAPGGWSSLYKLSVCCPGLLHSGVLLENSDFGLEREIGPDENYKEHRMSRAAESGREEVASSSSRDRQPVVSVPDSVWSLYDDLLFDTLYSDSATLAAEASAERPEIQPEVRETEDRNPDVSACKKRKIYRSHGSHLASGIWNLSREQGNKLLASRFKGDSLYICDRPGCVHVEEKRNYMLFRGIFKNFKQSRVWRTINDGCRSRIDLNCAFCSSKQTWDLHSSFCLRRYFGFHDDGEPVVRAYVCENGHVSGAWTDWPLYN